MKRNSATMNSAAAHKLGFPLSAACAPALIAARIDALLIPPNAAMMASRFGEPCISRRTSWKKDISAMQPVKCPRSPGGDNYDYRLLPRRPPKTSIAVRAAAPLAVAGRSGQQQ